MKKIIIIWILVLILLINNVSAFGITPGSKTFNFEPGLSKEFKLYVVNDEHTDMNIELSAEGDLKDYVTFSENNIVFSPEIESKEIVINLNLPNKIKEPGTHTIKIKALQSNVQIEQKGTLINANFAVMSLVNILVPYPGKYVEFSLDSNNINNKTILIVPVTNKGTENIKSAVADIEIYTLENEFVKTYKTNELSIGSKTKKELTSVIEDSIDSGFYTGRVTLIYDGRKESIEQRVTIGTSLMEILGIYVNNFMLGQIAKFDMVIQNLWNKEIINVFGNVVLYDAAGSEMANLKTPSETIGSLTKKVLSAYWDTKGVEEGTYSGKAVLNYENKTTEKKLKTYITLNSIKTEFIGTGLVVSDQSGSPINKEKVLKILVIILIVGNIAWFLYFRKKFKHEKSL